MCTILIANADLKDECEHVKAYIILEFRKKTRRIVFFVAFRFCSFELIWVDLVNFHINQNDIEFHKKKE
jgi:hypothetical protein